MFSFQRPRTRDIIFLLGILALGTALACQAWCNEPWNPDRFQIIDAPWVDNQQFSLYLDGSGTLDQSQNQDSMPTFSTYGSDDSRTSHQSGIAAAPVFNYQIQALAQTLNVGFPLSASFSTHESVNNLTRNSSGVITCSKSDSSRTQLAADPRIQYCFYGAPWFFQSDFIGSGDETFYRTENQQRYFANGVWQPEVKTSRVVETYAFNARNIFRAGWGRIFEGNHAYQAMQLLEELAQAKQLQRPASAEDIRDLSEWIRRGRLAIVSDSRLKIKHALKNILSFLKNRGLILPGDTDAFLTVDDIYRNITQAERPFGFSANGRLGTGIFVNNHEESDFNGSGTLTQYQKEETVPQQVFTGVEFRYEAPLSRQWQVGASACLDGYLAREHFKGYDATPYQFEGVGKAYGDYYFDTRWKVGAALALAYKRDTEPSQNKYAAPEQDVTVRYQRAYERLDLSLNAQNQLSPDFFLTFTLGGFYEKQAYPELFFFGDYSPGQNKPTLAEINAANSPELQAEGMNWYLRLSLQYRLM